MVSRKRPERRRHRSAGGIAAALRAALAVLLATATVLAVAEPPASALPSSDGPRVHCC